MVFGFDILVCTDQQVVRENTVPSQDVRQIGATLSTLQIYRDRRFREGLLTMKILNVDELGKPVSKIDSQMVDPNHVSEVYVNSPISGYISDGHVHLTLGIERPVLGDKSANPAVQKVVVSRLVIPAHIAIALAKAIVTTAQPAAGSA